MSGKALSNGTLSLRFMQNAQRAKMQAQVELEQAKVKDDAEWEVPQEIKEAWGIGSSTTSEENTIHESSYLPFLFPAGADAGSSSSGAETNPSAVLRGRRTFNERGQEILRKEKDESPEDEDEATVDPAGGLSRSGGKGSTRPTSISGFKVPLPISKKDGKKGRTKTAQMLIRESYVAETPPSLTHPNNNQPTQRVPASRISQPTQGSGFMKPVGIDDPRSNSAPKRDREQDLNADLSDPKNKKRKKKKADA